MNDCACGARGIDLVGHECVMSLKVEVAWLREEIGRLSDNNAILERIVNAVTHKIEEAKELLK